MPATKNAPKANNRPKNLSKQAKKDKAAQKAERKKAQNKKPYNGLSAETADRHALYQASVQNVEAEIDFVDATFEALRGRKAVTLREDFCGTGNTSCEWVRRHDANRAVGLDIDDETLAWGRTHNIGALEAHQQDRVALLSRDVRTPGDAVGCDCILAMNFSYWLFQERQAMIDYLKTVRESLAEDGILFMDFYGGSDSMTECEEKRSCDVDGKKFTYIWDQHKYNPITGEMFCKIHFAFPDGTRIDEAFNYTWRLWTLRELQDVLHDAGFTNVTVYWEGDELDDDGDPTGEGDGVFEATIEGEACEAYICYIVSEK